MLDDVYDYTMVYLGITTGAGRGFLRFGGSAGQRVAGRGSRV